MERSSAKAEPVMFKGRHFDQSVIFLCVRWYLAYNLSLRDLEEMMAERGLNRVSLGRSLLAAVAGALQPAQRAVGSKWHMEGTYIKVGGQWMYLYLAIDSLGDTVEFYFSETVTKRFLRKALARHGQPERIVSPSQDLSAVTTDTTGRMRSSIMR